MIRTEIIKQVKNLYEEYLGKKKKNNEEFHFGAYINNSNFGTLYGVKFVYEFDTNLMIICKIAGGESVSYSMTDCSYECDIDCAFKKFEKLYNVKYIWCFHSDNLFYICDDGKSTYIGKDPDWSNDDLKNYFEYDNYQEFYVIKRFDYNTDVSEIYKYINILDEECEINCSASDIYKCIKELDKKYVDKLNKKG